MNHPSPGSGKLPVSSIETPDRPASPSLLQDGFSPRKNDVHLPSTLTVRKWIACVLGLFLLAATCFVGSLSFGVEAISMAQLLTLLWQGPFIETSIHTDPQHIILWQVRIPRVLLAFFVGGSLAAVGATLQAMLRNPLADPYVIGISSGAALGAAIAILFGVGVSILSLSVLPFCAFLGALVSLLIVYRIAISYGSFSIHTLLLGGVVLNAIFSAFILFLTSLADPYRAFGMYSWLMGSLTGPNMKTVLVLAVYLLVGVAALLSQAPALNVITLGEESAKALGVEVERVKRVLFTASALVTGAVVAFSGLIGFVGLVVPHAVRLVFGADNRLVLVASGLVGGVFLMIADTVARTLLSPAEIPVGVVTALVGGPVFLYLLIQRRGRVMS